MKGSLCLRDATIHCWKRSLKLQALAKVRIALNVAKGFTVVPWSCQCSFKLHLNSLKLNTSSTSIEWKRMDVQFRPPVRDECDELVQMGERTGIFAAGEAQELLGQTLVDLLDGKLPHNHAYVLVHNSIAKGWVYFGPTEEPALWNLWWIGVDPKFMRQGFGKRLLQFVEDTVKSGGAGGLIIETSSSTPLSRTRDFYKRQGYVVSHVEADGYGQGEDKIVFVKRLNEHAILVEATHQKLTTSKLS